MIDESLQKEITNLSACIDEYADYADEIVSTHNNVVKQHDEEFERYENLKDHLRNIEWAIEIAQVVALAIQQRAHDKLARVTTACLQTVFYDEDYAFRLVFEKKRNKTEARTVLVHDGHEIAKPLEEDSGGVVDVAAFTLQLSSLMLKKPPVRRIMILDEPFKFVSVEYREGLRQMLEKLSVEFGFQFIMVTHIEELITGKVVKL